MFEEHLPVLAACFCSGDIYIVASTCYYFFPCFDSVACPLSASWVNEPLIVVTTILSATTVHQLSTRYISYCIQNLTSSYTVGYLTGSCMSLGRWWQLVQLKSVCTCDLPQEKHLPWRCLVPVTVNCRYHKSLDSFASVHGTTVHRDASSKIIH